METFSALLAICAGNSPVPGEFPTQRPVTRSFDVFFDLRLNKRLSKQWWGWWLETLSRHYEVIVMEEIKVILAADININIIKYDNAETLQYLTTLLSNGFLPYITLPTRIANIPEPA